MYVTVAEGNTHVNFTRSLGDETLSQVSKILNLC